MCSFFPPHLVTVSVFAPFLQHLQPLVHTFNFLLLLLVGEGGERQDKFKKKARIQFLKDKDFSFGLNF